MMFTCNISKKDRIMRAVFGSIFIVGIILNWSKTALIILSAILVIEGIIGWCGLGSLLDKLNIK